MITILAAIGSKGELGKNNSLLWKIPEDMQFFKTYTTGKTVIMGRKTYESIGRPLPNRKNIVVSSSPINGVVTCSLLPVALELVKDDAEIVIIGGGQLYKDAIELANKMLITHVHSVFEADVFFPEIDHSAWLMKKVIPSHDDHFDYSFVEYVRR